MVGVKTTREVLHANATLDTPEMGFTVQILMNVKKVVILAMFAECSDTIGSYTCACKQGY